MEHLGAAGDLEAEALKQVLRAQARGQVVKSCHKRQVGVLTA